MPVLSAGILMCAGCVLPSEVSLPPVMVASATGSVIIDGKAEEAFWRSAQEYPLLVPADRPGTPRCIQPGRVRFAQDKNFFYCFAELNDDDVVQEGENDDRNLYDKGDVLELFLAPEGSLCRWEILLGANGRYAVLFFPSPGRMIFSSALQQDVNLRLAVRVNGTLNDWRDRDCGYTLEAAIPLAELEKFGNRFESGCWTLLVGRYNYSVTLPAIEYSATSPLPQTNFHLRKEYRPIQREDFFRENH